MLDEAAPLVLGCYLPSRKGVTDGALGCEWGRGGK